MNKRAEGKGFSWVDKVQNTEMSERNSLQKSEIPIRTNLIFQKLILFQKILHMKGNEI